MNPGNVYTEAGWDASTGGPFFIPATDKDRLRGFVKDIFSDAKSEKLDALTNAGIPCLVELTPTCDHVARKTSRTRLLGGVLIKHSQDRSPIEIPTRNRMFAKQIEFCSFEGGVYRATIASS